jgi:hypothetical protein
MRWIPFCLAAAVLGAQGPLHVVAVVRRGPPPYEAGDRYYRLDGGQNKGLRLGDRFIVKRAGDATTLGHLRLVEVHGQEADARFEPAGASYPMKGDLVLRDVLKGIPAPSPVDPEPLPGLALPLPKPEAPPREGLLFFLPQKADLSLAGLKKLEGWVAAWGIGGRWAVQVPTARALRPALQKERAEAVQHALRALGIEDVKVESEPRTAESKYDPVWVRHWE